jgi:hypothetical protein
VCRALRACGARLCTPTDCGVSHRARPLPPVPQATLRAFYPNSRCDFRKAGASAAVNALLARLSARQRHFRAPSTWKTYLGPWTKAWTWCEPHLQEEMRAEGNTRWAFPTVVDLAAHAHIAHAFAQLRSEKCKIAAVTTTCTAINFAMALHECDDIMNAFPVKMLREVMRRKLGRPVNKMNELRRTECCDIVREWGFRSGCPWKRQIALMMALGRALLARFSDLAVVQVRGIVFLKGGALICVAHRKNSQHGKYTWLPLADSGDEYSTIRLLRLHLAGLGYALPSARWGADSELTRRVGTGKIGDGGGFLFCPMRRKGGHTHVMQRRYALQGGGASMLGSDTTGYKVVLAMMRRALRECCGYSATMAGTFGTHSCRRGGDTALFDAGVSQEKRQLLGMWKSGDVELTYIGFSATQHLEWARATAV